jgi:uncharacterized protein (TIGR02147 family)
MGEGANGPEGSREAPGCAAPAPEPASVTPPEILGYLDYRVWLRDHLEYLTQVDRKYSQRWVARRAGFKSPQLLSMIVTGQRNLTREKAIALARALKLSERESEYLGLIVDLAECAGEEARATLLARLKASFRDGAFAAISDEGIEIARDWYYPAIREAVTLAGAEADPCWVAGRLGIDPADAARALEVLERRGFLGRDARGRFCRTDPSVRTARHKVYPTLLGLYHLKVLERAFPAVRLPRDRRHFEALTVAVPRQLVPELKERIMRFFREIDALVEAETAPREEVMQLHLGMFPLTRWPLDAAKAAPPGVAAKPAAVAATPEKKGAVAARKRSR